MIYNVARHSQLCALSHLVVQGIQLMNGTDNTGLSFPAAGIAEYVLGRHISERYLKQIASTSMNLPSLGTIPPLMHNGKACARCQFSSGRTVRLPKHKQLT